MNYMERLGTLVNVGNVMLLTFKEPIVLNYYFQSTYCRKITKHFISSVKIIGSPTLYLLLCYI